MAIFDFQGFFNPETFDGHFYEYGNGSTFLSFSLPVPPGVSNMDYIIGATEWYYNNFTALQRPFMVGSLEVLHIWLDGK